MKRPAFLPIVRAVVLASALGLVPAAPARAVEVRDARVVVHEDVVKLEFRPVNTISDRIRGSLERGMPVTVLVNAEMWRVRPGWFDALASTRRSVIRIERDPWSDLYRVYRDQESPTELADLDRVEIQVQRPLRIRYTSASALGRTSRYYAIVRVDVKPLTVEDVAKVEDWLSGEAKRAGTPGPGSIAKLPGSLFGILANLSGFGDESTTWRGESFTVDQLARQGP